MRSISAPTVFTGRRFEDALCLKTCAVKRPPKKRKRRRPTLESKKKALEIAGWAMEKQARKVVIINIRKLSSVSDYILVCSAESERQVQAIATAIEEGLRKKGERSLGVEGVSEGKWALLDFNDVVVHVFLEPVRDFYDLEGLWAEAPKTEVKEKIRKAAAVPSPRTASGTKGTKTARAGAGKPKARPRTKKKAAGGD